MFGFRSPVPSRAHRSLLEAENALAAQSQRHPHGWGIGWFVADEAYVLKSATSAHTCDRFQRMSARLTSETFLVHVRRATVGHVDHVNAHPFRFGRWLFCHNGTIFGFERMREWVSERILPSHRAQIVGDTDSEHLFHLILARLAAAGIDATGRVAGDGQAIGRVVRQVALELDAEARRLDLERPIVNILLTDGRSMVAHRAGMPLFIATQKSHCADFHTCPEPSKVCMLLRRPANTPVNHLLVASEQIGADENRWEAMEDGETLVLDARYFLHRTPPPARWEAPILPTRFRIDSTAPA
ncbi:MAG: putative glutamine amidotransferase [Myxococcota bacterium]|jgi:predicted glutamine amidotransferase